MRCWVIVVLLWLLLFFRSSPMADRLLKVTDGVFRQSLRSLRELTSVEEPPDDRRFVPSRLRDRYARQLARCARPGPNVQRFVGRLEGSPREKLVEAYRLLRKRWEYRPDGRVETFQTAEASLGSLHYQGDCEDFAAAMMAILTAVDGLTSRIVIHRGQTPRGPGHAYCEVLIATDPDRAAPLLRQLRQEWELPHVASRRDEHGVWVRLDFSPPREHYDGGPVGYFIWPDGRVTFP